MYVNTKVCRCMHVHVCLGFLFLEAYVLLILQYRDIPVDSLQLK